MQRVAERSDMATGFFGPRQKLLGAEGRPGRSILFLDAMPAALLAQVLTQQLAGERIDQPDVRGVPLHSHTASDPTGRRAVIGRLDSTQPSRCTVRSPYW
jgi:hypothetical protein